MVTTLEGQLSTSRQEKEQAVEAARAEKRTWERLHKEQEKQLRELEKQRDKAQAEATEASAGRRRAQEALEASRRSDSEVVRSLQAEKTGMAKELKELKATAAAGVGDNQISELVSSVAALQRALGSGSPDDLGEQLRLTRDAKLEAEAKLDALRTTLRTELLAVTEEKEAALAELQIARGGETVELQRMRAEYNAAQSACEEQRSACTTLRAELTAERAAKDKLLVQARLDQAAATSRAREHTQQLSAKDVQLSALERELSSMAGQLVASQAEVRLFITNAEREGEGSLRERTSLLQQQQALESDKGMLEAQLQGAEQQRMTLVEQISQSGADREFCFEIIRDLKAQLTAATKAFSSVGGGPQEVRL